ncbi:Ig-like domain-containing protein [Flavobacterium silvaticum]|uniref:T9SS type B sorting domain-containing protein n=1 Tax=Flavobacterium silvaticum TaxID=1852020 RepID=A0A972FK16_9FLAO|nr:T9SS type B sorting domain-containing protein [Flavobacterium silvaticum]NMH27474.1 T9SS type B sorting domain-containing protein [Flavobacterium silvaticum]
MSITPDPADNFLDAVYIQISTGYQAGTDQLSLSGSHPEVTATWNSATGKLSITSVSGPLLTTVFEDIIEDVVYNSSLPAPNGTRNFSITIGQANYLPSTDHYYRFIPSIGITWSQAKIEAENSTYYGLQGYLATIGAQDEAVLSGEQSSGAGWIGGSDQATEGVWMWVTGPENGSIFWNNGITLTYSNWNVGEPNNAGNEDYAHVTAPGVGTPGSWNDLSNTGEASGDYQPKGYIVEYGGMPGDPILQISTSTTISVPRLLTSTPASRCGDGTLTLTATAEFSSVYWYDSATGGNLVFTGNSFTTPFLTSTTNYYASAFPPSCTTGARTLVAATVNPIPALTITPPAPSCEGIVTIHATSTTGTVNWYDDPVAGTLVFTGADFTTPFLTESATYYLEAFSQTCPGGPRQAVTAVVYEKPQVTDEPNVGICENDSVLLDAGISGQTYLWNPGGETTQTKLVSASGVYTVTVTSPAPENCSAVKTITVLEKRAPIISSVVVIGNVLTVYTENAGDFEYSIDGGPFQASPVFGVDGSPISEITANEIHGCGDDSVPFTAIVSIPLFFTPNQDGFNDIWTATSLIFYPGASLSIFDRFGKLIQVLDKSNLVWDGTYISRQMPSDDYWFLLDLANGTPVVRGHFTLKR